MVQDVDLFGENRDSARRITRVTRRGIFDYIHFHVRAWFGRLDEVAFIGRLYDLAELPSTDGRFRDAGRDIWQHRINNEDWEDDWVFSDSRFRLASGPDEVLLGFLAQMVHPVVRPDPQEAAGIVAELNRLLAPDGWMLRQHTQMSGRPQPPRSTPSTSPNR